MSLVAGDREPGRLIGIDVLRAVAILAVLASHWRNSSLSAPASGALETIALAVARNGNFGVILFFVISGFVIARTIILRDGSLLEIDWRAFYVRRAGRILPLFCLWLVLGVAVMALPSGEPDVFAYAVRDPAAQFGWPFWASIMTFVFNFERWLSGETWGLHWDIAWSLAVEEQFYLFFPLLLLRLKSAEALYRTLLALVGAAIVFRLGAEIAMSSRWEDMITATPACLDALAAGVLTAMLAPRVRWQRDLAAFVALLSGMFLVAAYTSEEWVMKPALLAAALAPLILAAQTGNVFCSAAWRPLARIGRVSYGMYLLHPLALYALSPWLRDAPFVAGYALLVAMSFGVAQISYFAIERPANRWIRAAFGRRAVAAPAE
jgi:peptidoglycan/LPS O-acetylase OafA/YrhL